MVFQINVQLSEPLAIQWGLSWKEWLVSNGDSVPSRMARMIFVMGCAL